MIPFLERRFGVGGCLRTGTHSAAPVLHLHIDLYRGVLILAEMAQYITKSDSDDLSPATYPHLSPKFQRNLHVLSLALVVDDHCLHLSAVGDVQRSTDNRTD